MLRHQPARRDVGGCLEYLSLIFGYRALLVLAAMLYVGAYLVMPRSRTSATPADGTDARERRPAVAGFAGSSPAASALSGRMCDDVSPDS